VGAATDRHLGIPGEDLPGSWSATEFVSWYSAHPDSAADGFVVGARSAVVIGVGNVAVDVTRMLARGLAELNPTDMPQAALAALAASQVREIHMVGRRGPSQARFTTKELRELGGLPGTEVAVDPEELALDPAYADPVALPAAQRRNVEVLRGWATTPAQGTAPHRIRLRFFLRPVELLADAGRVGAVRFERTVPDGHGGVQGTGRFEPSWCCGRWAIAGCRWRGCRSIRRRARCRSWPAGCCATARSRPASTRPAGSSGARRA
jgi:ferredoxin--NADP+ reductase